MGVIDEGALDKRIRIERPVAAEGWDRAGLGTWQPVATVWASVLDMLPSRGERMADGINVAARPARVRIRYRPDITAAMRFVLGSRIMQVVAGPAELGSQEGLEFMVEDYTSAGNPA